MMIWDFIVRLLIAGILGAVIGLDREYRAKEAGYRTHFLVSLGSALIMIVSQYGFQQIIQQHGVSLDPSRVAAQVVSGIGFIGAGTIIIQKQFVRGLTTAAGIWATAGIGLACGSGMYALAAAATGLTLVGLELLSFLFKSLGMKSSLIVLSTTDKNIIKKIIPVLQQSNYLLSSYELKELSHMDKETYLVSIVIKAKKSGEENPVSLFTEAFPEITIERIE